MPYDNRTEIRMTPAQERIWREAARKAKRKLSEWIRMTLTEQACNEMGLDFDEFIDSDPDETLGG